MAKVSWTRSSASAGLRVIRIARRVQLVQEGQGVALEAQLTLRLALGLRIDLGRVGRGGVDGLEVVGIGVTHRVPE